MYNLTHTCYHYIYTGKYIALGTAKLKKVHVGYWVVLIYRLKINNLHIHVIACLLAPRVWPPVLKRRGDHQINGLSMRGERTKGD